MEIYPIVIHESANEWVEGKPQPADKMRKEYNPLMGFHGRDNLSRGREMVHDLLGQIPGLPEFLDILLLDGGGHPLALRSGSRHGWSVCSWKGLELGC